MKIRLAALLLLTVVLAGCQPKSGVRFDKEGWNKGRQDNPELNVSPWMLDDLVTNHLSLGMSLTDATNLLGQPEIESPLGTGVRVKGEFLEQTVYLYQPRMHNGWLLEGTNLLTLYFGRDGRYLKEWFPAFPVVRPLSAKQSEATQNTLSNGGLYIGNLHFAAMPNQFDELLGPPDERRTEYQLEYFLGKRSRLSSDEVFLELHFDQNRKLTRIERSEH